MSTKPILKPEEPALPKKKWWRRHKWHKRTGKVILFLAVVLAVHAGLREMYEFWDVGSDSWFARFQGHQWELQRGAALVQHDSFGDSFTSIRYLDQGWKPSESMWFYYTTQGSDLLPYDFFLSLEKAGTTDLLRSNEILNGFRYLPQKPTRSNPDGLPVGFVRDTYKKKEYLGFTCAACHTSQLNYNNIGIRIDGAPAGSDMDGFLIALKDSLNATYSNHDVQQRFVKRVLDLGHYSSEDDVAKDLKIYSQRMAMYYMVNHSPQPYGYSRLDAFGRIYNRVLEHVLTQDDLKFTLNELKNKGKISEEEFKEASSGPAGNVLNGEQRDHVAMRLALALPLKAQVKLKDRLFNTPDAPVSYPFLWDIPQQDYVQWNGLAPNAGLSSLGRNTGEVIGVFATLDWSEKPGFSISSLIGGQGIHATHISFESSVNVHNLKGIEHQLWSLHSPKWPKDILGPINEELRGKGEILFKQYCVSCHTEVDRDDPNRRGVAHITRLKDIGTDPKMAANATNYGGLSGILKNQYVNTGGGQVLINKSAPAADLLTQATINVIATPLPGKNPFIRVLDWADDLIAAYFTNEIKPSIKRGNYDPDTTSAPYSSLLSYKARSLNGIWATAPYLHNGSVPTLYDLLLPPKGKNDPPDGEYRPPQFQVGSRQFDPKKVGFITDGYTGFTFDTRDLGNSNAGHLYGTKGLSSDDRWALVEYLKSL